MSICTDGVGRAHARRSAFDLMGPTLQRVIGMKMKMSSQLCHFCIVLISFTHFFHRQHVYMYVYYVWVLDGCVLI